jgi:coronin-1B/1C/6
METAASKFADNDEEAEHSDASSFEEIQKPVVRPSVMAARQDFEAKSETAPKQATNSSVEPKSLAAKDTYTGEGLSAASSLPAQEVREKVLTEETKPLPAPATSAAMTNSSASTTSPATTTPTASAAAGGLKDILSDIRSLLQAQGQKLEAQSQQLAQLTDEVAQMKAKVSD